MEKVIGVLGAFLIIATSAIIVFIIAGLRENDLWIFNKKYWEERGNNKISAYCNECKARIRNEAIDEFYNRLLVNKKDINLANNPWNYIELVAREMTEQLKEK